MSILTAGYPAEYGRKLGGVIEVTTERDSRPGLHGKADLSGGSFSNVSGFLMGQYSWGHNTFTASGNGAMTDRYLDPPVEQNYTNHGSTSGFTSHYERDLNDSNRIGFIVRRQQAHFLVPNETTQQIAGQRQDRDDFETSGTFSYQHIFSPNIVGDLRLMGRDLSANLWSNPTSTPILAYQQREYREQYAKASLSVHASHQEFKFGVEGDFASVHENFNYRIIDRRAFDSDTPRRFAFGGFAKDREQSWFAQDQIRLGDLTVSAGLRWDRYKLLVTEAAVSPRLGVAYYWRKADVVFHASYDRVFQTPAVENILLASSTAVDALNDTVLRLPVRPSLGNFYEAGLSKGLFGKLRLDANYFRRNVDNFADDDVFLNTGVSFPIAFQHAEIAGLETKLAIPRWGRISGFLSYSNQKGNWIPAGRGWAVSGRQRIRRARFARWISDHAGPAQHRPRTLSLPGDAEGVGRGGRHLRQRSARRVRGRSCHGSRSIWAKDCGSRELRSRTSAAVVFIGCFGRDRPGEPRKSQTAIPG